MGRSLRISRASDYAFRAMVYLAANGSKPVETARVADEVGVPSVYLRKIFQTLARSGLVKTTAGTGGGVVLGVSADEVTLKDIMEAIEGPITLSDCVDEPETCRRSGKCTVHLCLSDIQEHLRGDFASRRLSELI